MALRLRGNSWYLRKMVGGVVKDVALGVYGDERDRKRAAKAAKAMAASLTEAHAATKVLRRYGFDSGDETAAPARPTLTVADWWERYRTTYGPLKAPRTREIDARVMAHWLPILGAMPLADVKQMHCEAGLAQRRVAHAANPGRKVAVVIKEGTVQRERRFLRALFQRAVDNDLLTKNPWQHVKGKVDVARSDRILTVEDEGRLRAVLTTARPDAVGRPVRLHPRYLRFVEFLLETGLRIDELLNTQFVDEGDYVRVVGKGSKERRVRLTTKARRALTDQQADPDRPTRTTRPWWQTEQRFRAVLKAAAIRANIPHLSPHDLRHTFGHRYLTRGGDIYSLSKILGHASVAVTERHYAYLRKEDVGDMMMAVMEPSPRA